MKLKIANLTIAVIFSNRKYQLHYSEPNNKQNFRHGWETIKAIDFTVTNQVNKINHVQTTHP